MNAETLPLIVTAWTTLPDYDPCEVYQITPDEAALRDAYFRQVVVNMLSMSDPTLLDTIQKAGGNVLARPSRCEVVDTQGNFFNLPHVSAALAFGLWPWVDALETAH